MTIPLSWQVDLATTPDTVAYFSGALEEDALVSSCFEDEASGNWTISLFYGEDFNPDLFSVQLELLIDAVPQLKRPIISIKPVEQKDWVTESQMRFEPITAGHFYIHPSWVKPDTITAGPTHHIMIDPCQAFGTGAHATTKGCLLALSYLYDQQLQPKPILDMGTGTGILALAAHRLWPTATTLAVDNDPVAVTIATTLCQTTSITCLEADSFTHPTIVAKAPYELIIANILARPLIEMSASLRQVSTPGTMVVLSGFYEYQANDVAKAYTDKGYDVIWQQLIDRWQTLVLCLKN